MTTCDFLMSNRRYSARSRQWHFNLNLWWKLRKRGVPLGRRTRWFETLFGCYFVCLGNHSSGARSCSHRMFRWKPWYFFMRGKVRESLCHTWTYRSLTPNQTQPEYFFVILVGRPWHIITHLRCRLSPNESRESKAAARRREEEKSFKINWWRCYSSLFWVFFSLSFKWHLRPFRLFRVLSDWALYLTPPDMFLASPDIWMEFEIFRLKLFRLIIKANWGWRQMPSTSRGWNESTFPVFSSRDDSTLLDYDKWKNKHFHITVN